MIKGKSKIETISTCTKCGNNNGSAWSEGELFCQRCYIMNKFTGKTQENKINAYDNKIKYI